MSERSDSNTHPVLIAEPDTGSSSKQHCPALLSTLLSKDTFFSKPSPLISSQLHYKSSSHFKDVDWDERKAQSWMSGNVKSADGQMLDHGKTVCFTEYEGRWQRGIMAERTSGVVTAYTTDTNQAGSTRGQS